MSEITQVNVPIFFHFFDAFQFESSSVIVQRVGRHLSGKIGNSEWAKSTGGNQPSSVDSGIGSPRSLQGQIYSPKVVFVLVLFVQPVYFKIQRQPLYCLFFLCFLMSIHSLKSAIIQKKYVNLVSAVYVIHTYIAFQSYVIHGVYWF